MKAKITWFEKSLLTLENIQMEFTIGIIDDKKGYFEMSDIKTGGNDWYAEGGLWFDNKKVTDYDGVLLLPPEIVNELERMGYDVTQVNY